MNTSSDTHVTSRRGLGLIFVAALLWGTVGITSQAIYNIASTNALSIGFFRLAIAGPCLLVACWHGKAFTFQMTRRDLFLMFLIGATMALYQVCFMAAIPKVGVAVTVLVTLCTAPVIVALLAAAFLDERLTARVVLALMGALAGTVLLSWANPDLSGSQRETFIGIGLALGSALGFSVMTLCSRALAGRYHPLQTMGLGLGEGAVLLLPFALASGMAITYSLRGWGLLLYLGLVPTALAFVLFLTGIRHATATTASIITLLEPLTATVLAWLLFDERLGPLGLLGAALLLGAIGILYRGAGGSEKEPAEPAQAELHTA